MLPDHFRLFAARPAPLGSLEAEMPGLLVAQPVDEAARRHLNVRVYEDRVLLDWASYATSLGDPDRQEILLGDRLCVLCMAKNREPAVSVKSSPTLRSRLALAPTSTRGLAKGASDTVGLPPVIDGMTFGALIADETIDSTIGATKRHMVAAEAVSEHHCLGAGAANPHIGSLQHRQGGTFVSDGRLRTPFMEKGNVTVNLWRALRKSLSAPLGVFHPDCQPLQITSKAARQTTPEIPPR